MKIQYFIIAILLLFSGCRADFDFRKNRLSDFGKEFIDSYGWPDSRQTWNTSTQFQVAAEIEKDGNWELKVYTANPNTNPEKAFLIGRFDVASMQTDKVLVDGPYTLQSVYVGVENGTVCAQKEVEVSNQNLVDVIFYNEDFVEGKLPDVPKMSYFLVYEIVDSISTFLDYNDVVLEIVHVSGEETADIKLHTAGALEEMRVLYRQDDADIILYDDVHGAFGYRTPDYLINVNPGFHRFRMPIERNLVPLGKEFTVTNDASNFIVQLKHKKQIGLELSLNPNMKDCLGLPSNAILISNPTWDWTSEGASMLEAQRSFPFWLSTYHLYNDWWDSLWDPHELVIEEDGSYRPDFDYKDMIFGIEDIAKNGDLVPEIGYQSFLPYVNGKIGVNLGFVIVDRDMQPVKIMLERTDGGLFEHYPLDEDGICRAFVDVYGEDMNVDAGMGCRAESCHILLTTKTIQQIINERCSIRVKFHSEAKDAKINSVWIKNR